MHRYFTVLSLLFPLSASASTSIEILERAADPRTHDYTIVADSARVRDLRTGREFTMEVPEGARNGDIYDVEISRRGGNPGIDLSDTYSDRVRDSNGRTYDTHVPRNARQRDFIIYRKR